jgi:hypothetical protein
MKIFGRTGGYYLFWCSFIYLAIGLPCALYYKEVHTEYIQMIWICALALPLLVPPVARYFNMEPVMFDLFKKKSNVVAFPKVPKTEVKTPYTPPEPEKPATTYYRLGITSNGRVSFQMGYSEITMNANGIDNMIAQLEVFRDQITEYEDNGPEDDPDDLKKEQKAV